MRHTKTVRVPTELLEGVSCDRCRQTVDACDTIELGEMLQLEFTAGYGSPLGDGKRYQLDLCKDCVKAVLGPFLRLID